MLTDIEDYIYQNDCAFGIISAHDNNQKVSINLDRNLNLASYAKKKGFDYVWLEGYWTSQNGTEHSESSLFLAAKPGDNEKLFNFLQEHAKAANQEGFIFRNENDDTVTLEYTNGQSEKVGKYQPNKLGDFYSRIAGGRHKGKSFVFASATLVKALAELV